MRVSEAISEFQKLAAQSGFAASYDPSPNDFGSSVTRVCRSEAELRLVWDGRDKYLSVQVTHGPLEIEAAGWLELWGAQCAAEAFNEKANENVTFKSAIEYGIELMGT